MNRNLGSCAKNQNFDFNICSQPDSSICREPVTCIRPTRHIPCSYHPFRSIMSSFPTSDELLPLLKSYYGYTTLRPNQAKVIDAVLSRYDVLFTAPTGHGKSMCFQLPALYYHQTSPTGCLTIVVSPLVSLMHNHVQALKARNVPCALISSAETQSHNQTVITSLQAKGPLPYALLYITPERLVMSSFLNILIRLHKSRRLAFVAIDEAHCISQWGHDFRKAYARLGIVKQTFPSLPIIALTATATRSVMKDIKRSLNISEAKHIHTSFLRTNIRYIVKSSEILTTSTEEDICSYIVERNEKTGFFEKGIIYAFKRETVDQLAFLLKQYGIPVRAYHAGLSNKERKQAQDEFENGDCPIVVASTAFGMGIDVSAIRYVIHHSIPKSLEAFYQESGRAGRDGLNSDSIVYFSSRDSSFLRFLNEQSLRKEEDKPRKITRDNALVRMEDYCTEFKCRRVAILGYFGESALPEKICGPHGCDVCADNGTGKKRRRIEMNTSASNSFRRASSKFQSPAAEFQTARALLKVKQQQNEEKDNRINLKRKRSSIHNDSIGDFSGDDEPQPSFQTALDAFKFSDNVKSDLKELEKMEEAESKKTTTGKKNAKSRLRERLNSVSGSSTNGGIKKSKLKQSKLGFVSQNRPKNA